MDLQFSIIIPVYNRPKEVADLLQSLSKQTLTSFEVLVIEDGSTQTAEQVCNAYTQNLNLRYFKKSNSGAGQSRNYGMERAQGNYFIILDSDCILPQGYMDAVVKGLNAQYTDGFGGADAAHPSFSILQKSISYVMTSMLTTGGIRGSKALKNFQPRSFNMGLSKKAFALTKGFSKMTVGEDIDLSFRLAEVGCKTQFLADAFVYHKRRITWTSFFKQTFNFGAARPILNRLFPGTAKLTYWFPSIFVLGVLLVFVLSAVGYTYLGVWGLLTYLLLVFVHSMISNSSVLIALYTLPALLVMFFGYGLGFLRSSLRIHILRRSLKKSFPKMFGL